MFSSKIDQFISDRDTIESITNIDIIIEIRYNFLTKDIKLPIERNMQKINIATNFSPKGEKK